jgi:hypothetical protein
MAEAIASQIRDLQVKFNNEKENSLVKTKYTLALVDALLHQLAMETPKEVCVTTSTFSNF